MTVFVVCAIVGGLLVLLGLLGSDHSVDLHADAHMEIDHGVDGGGFLHDLPIFSLRFWSYGLLVFGITGYILASMARLPFGLAATAAVVVGLLAGSIIVYALRALSKQLVSTGASIDELLGSEAVVTVAVRGETPGRIRCTLKGEIIDLLAVSDHNERMEAGTKVIIAAIENDRARILPQSALYGSETVSVNS